MVRFYSIQNIAKYKYLFGLFDVILYVGIVALFAEFYTSHHSLFNYLGISESKSFWLLMILLPTFLFILYFNNLYKINIILDRSAHTTAIIKSLLYFLPLMALMGILILKFDFVCLITTILTFIVVYLPIYYIFRIELLRRTYLLLNKNRLKRNVLIIGNGGSGEILATKLSFENSFGIHIVGFVDEKLNKGEEVIRGKHVLGRIGELNQIVGHNNIDEIIIADDTSEYEDLLSTIDICKQTKVKVKFTSNLFKIIPQRIFTERYAEIPIVNVSIGSNSVFMLRIKSIFDKIAAFLGLIFLSPFLLLISILVKLSSSGPIFYKQIRIGKNGKPFNFYKFRTMKTIENDDDAERKEMMINFMRGKEVNGDNKKVINPKRLTAIGKLLRKTSLDELPQLLNVLLGDMSLVGPRPCLPYEYEHLQNWQKRRVEVLPGCTGMWQVAGRSQVSFQDSVVMDLYYINNMSPWLDLQLLIKTIPVMLFGKGGN